MSPYEIAATWHQDNCPEVPFRHVLEAHLFHGHVLSNPEVFVLVRQVRREWPAVRLLDPWDTCEAGDCWHVWLWAGEVGDWRKLVPWALPWISFHRGEELKVHRFPAGK